MNPKLLKLIAFLLILAGVLSACKKPEDTKIDYPINIPFTEYSLDETSCQWKNLPYDEKVIIINSNAALENYLSFTGKSYPAIDFSKNSLLLTSGKTTTGIAEIFAKDLKQLSSQKYELNLSITLSDTSSIEQWCMALVVEKIGNESDVELNINFDEEEIDYPINIPFTKYSLDETSCQWKNLPYDEKVIIINSNAALENYISCSKKSYPAIDFSKNSLLLTSGKTTTGITEIFAKDLKQLSSQKYELNLSITLSDTSSIEQWCMALVVEKIGNESDVELNINFDEEEIVYPRNIPFIEYSLDKTSCQWINLPYDKKVIIINSDEALENYISCTQNSYPVIDFSKKSLLLASGISNPGVSSCIAKALLQLAHKRYELEIEIDPGMAAVVTPWQEAIIINKIDADCIFDLKIKYVY